MRFEWRDRMVAADGPHETSLTLAWLATHRGRLRSLLFGGHRLSVLIVWDDKGQAEVEHSDEEVAALVRVVYEPRPGPGDATCDIPDPRPLYVDGV